MQGGRDPFGGFGNPFGGFGGQRSIISSFLGGRDPFDDPFFTNPFGSTFGSSMFGPGRSPFQSSVFGSNRDPFESSLFGPPNQFFERQSPGFLEHQPSRPTRSTGPIIEELDSDDEKEEEKADKEENPRKHRRTVNEPFVEDPDDAAEEKRSKLMQFRNDFNGAGHVQSQPHSHTFTFHSSSISIGGRNGVYRTSSTTRRSGSDGLTFEEMKEANSATGQATHRVSRGLHSKGHSVTRKLKSDGAVDTMQTLHNLDQDELAGFEETWKGKAQKHLPGWSDAIHGHGDIGSGSRVRNAPNRGGWALPSVERSNHPRSARPELQELAGQLHPQNAARRKTNAGDKIGTTSAFRSYPSDANN